jgi:hypothetical protein
VDRRPSSRPSQSVVAVEDGQPRFVAGHAGCLGQDALWSRDVAEHGVAHDEVEGAIIERKLSPVAGDK